MNVHVIIGADDFLVAEAAKRIVGDGVGLEVVDSVNSTNADLQLADIERRLSDTHRLTILLEESARNYFIAKGYQPKYGARPLKRLLQSELEDLLAEEILKGSIRDGDTVSAAEKDGRIVLAAAAKG